jgi:hypothetical protein
MESSNHLGMLIIYNHLKFKKLFVLRLLKWPHTLIWVILAEVAIFKQTIFNRS